MSTVYEEFGRTRQKARTRSQLIDATRALIAAGTASAACSTVGEAVPAAISALVAAISWLRVRAFCRVRPDSS